MRYKKIGNQGHFFNTTVYREESCIFKYIKKNGINNVQSMWLTVEVSCKCKKLVIILNRN